MTEHCFKSWTLRSSPRTENKTNPFKKTKTKKSKQIKTKTKQKNSVKTE